jgi:hypothetical protein
MDPSQSSYSSVLSSPPRASPPAKQAKGKGGKPHQQVRQEGERRSQRRGSTSGQQVPGQCHHDLPQDSCDDFTGDTCSHTQHGHRLVDAIQMQLKTHRLVPARCKRGKMKLVRWAWCRRGRHKDVTLLRATCHDPCTGHMPGHNRKDATHSSGMAWDDWPCTSASSTCSRHYHATMHVNAHSQPETHSDKCKTSSCLWDRWTKVANNTVDRAVKHFDSNTNTIQCHSLVIMSGLAVIVCSLARVWVLCQLEGSEWWWLTHQATLCRSGDIRRAVCNLRAVMDHLSSMHCTGKFMLLLFAMLLLTQGAMAVGEDSATFIAVNANGMH